MSRSRTGSGPRRGPRRRARQRRWLLGAVPWWGWLGAVLLIASGVNWAVHNVSYLWLWVAAGLAVAALGAGAAVSVRRARARAWLAAHADLKLVDGLNGPEFETFVARLLRRDGHRGVTVLGGAGDGGVDIVGRTPAGARFVVQCKRYARPVAPAAVREFHGVLATTHPEHIGVFVASNGFSPAARSAGAGLVLVDRARLARWAEGRSPLALDPA